MTEWDKLWKHRESVNGAHIHYFPVYMTQSDINWLAKVKAEGDKLKEKADLFDLQKARIVVSAKHLGFEEEQILASRKMAIKEMIEITKKTEKLEVIRNILCPINMDVSPYEIINRIRRVLEK